VGAHRSKGRARTWRSPARSAPRATAASTRLGDRIQVLRRKLKLTQEEMADRAHLDAKHLQTIEHGKTNPTLATLVAIADALDVTLSVLLRGV
jgi:DNA-binding XRE family transcriptional regulator